MDDPGQVEGDVDKTALDGEKRLGHIEDEEESEDNEMNDAEDATPVAPGEGQGVGQDVGEHSAQLAEEEERSG